MMPPTPEQLQYVAAFREPNAFYVDGPDNLRVTSLNSVSGVVVTINGRMLTPDGHITPFTIPHVPNSDRTVRNQIHMLGEGWIQNLSAVVTTGAPQLGQTFIRVEVVRGSTGAVEPLAVLMQGLITAVQKIGFPGSPNVATRAYPGAIRAIQGTDPAAGVEVSETVPTGAVWRLLTLRTTLTTDATVANRRAIILIDDGSAIVSSAAGSSDVPASTAAPITLMADFGTAQSSGGHHLIHAPGSMLLRSGYRIRTSTNSFQAGDNYSVPQMLVEEWLEGA